MSEREKTEEPNAGENLKLVLHEAVHKVLDQKKESPGWYGEAIPTALVGISLLKHSQNEIYKKEIDRIEEELKNWVHRSNFKWDYELAGLGLYVSFLQNLRASKEEKEYAINLLVEKVDHSLVRSKEGKDNFLNTPIYVWSAIRGLYASDKIKTYKEDLNDIINRLLETNNTIKNKVFLYSSKYLLNDQEEDPHQEILEFLHNINPEQLQNHEVIPVVWFIESYLDGIAEKIKTENIAIKQVRELKSTLWSYLFEVSLEKYLSRAGGPLMPSPTEAAFLDELLGREINSINFLTDSELESNPTLTNQEKNRD